ncbi:Vacuolar protein sorting-associated protein 41 [Entophlyctis luteolus]|nr:Vacuolar protein sorting-associated protein 41 [Entophlyctis luteolus]
MSLQHEDVPESATSLGSGLLPTNHKDGEEDDDDDEDDEDEDDDDEDDDDVEPMLKYQRLSANLADALKKDAVAAMAVSDRFLALGTHWGVVHILDLAGNNVKRFACHSATVNDLAIDDSGEFVASASDDGRVIINSLYTPEVFQFKHKRPVKCVSLEPEYSRKQSRMHVSGGSAETLLLTGKGWFSSFDTVIGSGEGAIWAVEWRTNDATFGSIERPANSPRSDLYRCNICWKDNTTLMVGWADSVKICVVKDRAGKKATDTTRSLSPPSSNLNLNLPTKYVEIVCEFRTEFIISGIAPLRDQIVLLAFITDTGDRQNIDILPTPENNVAEKLISEPPEVHVVDMNGDQVANDVLSLFGFEHYRANDYRLAFLPSSTTIADTTFYIVSPKDIVVAKPRDLDDHIEFLVSKARYEEALAAAERATVNKREVDGSLYQGRMRVEDVVSIGIKYLTSLMQDGDYEQAAAMTPKILRTDPKLWEQWIYSFMGIDKLAVLLPFIPFSQLQLNKAVYEMILSRFLETDERTFLDLIQQWPSNWYSAATVADGVEVKLAKDESNSVLLDAAVKLPLFMVSVAENQIFLTLSNPITCSKRYKRT